MVRNDKKIERPGELCFLTFGRGNFFTPGKPQSRFSIQAITKTEGIDTVIGMQMGITPKNLLWVSRLSDFFFGFRFNFDFYLGITADQK